jgi:hypothetical protein
MNVEPPILIVLAVVNSNVSCLMILLEDILKSGKRTVYYSLIMKILQTAGLKSKLTESTLAH